MTLRTFIAIALLLAGCTGDASFGGKSKQTDSNLRAVDNYQFALADSNLVKAVAQDSTSPAGYYGLGYSAEHQLLYFDAISNYLRALDHARDFAPALAGLARTYPQLGATQEALDASRQYTSLAKTDPDGWLVFAKNLIAAHEFTDLGQALQQAEAAGVDPGMTNLLRATAAAVQHDFQAATQFVQQAGKPKTPQEAMALADCLEARGMLDSAMIVSRAAYDDDNSHDIFVEHFFRSLRTGYASDARDLLAEMSRRDKTNILNSAGRYFYYSAVGDRRHAGAATDDLSTLQPTAFSSYAYQFTAHDRMNDGAGASAIADELFFTVDHGHISAHFDAFMRSYVASMRTQGMIPLHAQMVLDSITDPQVRAEVMYQITYANALYRGQSVEGLDTLYARYMGERASNASFLSGLAALRPLVSPALMPSADSVFQMAMAADNADLTSFQRWIDAHLRWGDWQGILAAFEHSPQFAERYPAMAMTKAAGLAWLDRPDEAVALASANLPKVQGNSLLLNQLVRGLILRQRFDQTKTVVSQAVDLQKNNPDILAVAAFAYGEMGDWNQAATFADRGLSKEPNHPWLLAEKARALAQTGKSDQAARIFDTLVVDMANTEGLLYYSRVLAQNKSDLPRAQDLARQAAYTGQLYYRATYNLANIYLITGRPDLARGAAQVAIKTGPNDPEGYYLLGMALFAEKNAEARGALQKAIDLGLKGDQLQQAQATLTRI